MSLVNIKDLMSVNKKILIFNLTSSTEFLDSSQIVFSEFFDRGIKLILPARVCSNGHSLLIAICRAGTSQNVSELKPNSDVAWAQFVGIGKVEQFETLDNGLVTIEIKFTQFKALDWEKLISELRQAQVNVDTVLNKMKAS